MRYIWIWLVVVAAICGCDEVAPEFLTPPATDTAVEDNMLSFPEVELTADFPTELYVRVVYVEPRLPAGQETRYPERAAEIDALVREVQTFFADELERHGYPRRTFTVRETDGRVRVERLTLEHEASFYETADGRLQLALEEFEYELFGEYGHGHGPREFYISFVDVPGYRIETFSGDACAVGSAQGTHYGAVTIPRVRPMGCNATADLLTHELMHAFGLLGHDWRSDDYMLSYGASRHKISRGAAGWLARHPAFIGRVPVSEELGTGLHVGEVVLSEEPTLSYRLRRGASGIYAFELRFTAWFLSAHLQQESGGFVHGVLLYDDDNRHDVQNRRWGIHVLRYLDKDTDANVLRSLDNDTLQRQYIGGGVEYVVRFEAELPVPDDGFILELLQYDGVAHSIYMKYSERGGFHREW